MENQLPDYFFRIRGSGALVFRVDTENRQRRLEMVQIASVNMNKGEFKPHGDAELSEADAAAITDWISARGLVLDARTLEEMTRTVEHLNLASQWVISKAKDHELDAITDELLLAMHDLRSALVRKKSQREN